AYPFAIYADGVMVGFVMLGYYERKNQYTLWKFLIDERYQNRGYGREALGLAVQFLVERFHVREVYTAYISSNSVARDLYASFGFRETGEVEENQVEMRYVLDGGICNEK
ncbi:MAG: GNAT family N-acetyltransferase, partial [Acutalibacter sp.]|nr:GNAT family N-acetyltransferase [Acutalibacter sp.]